MKRTGNESLGPKVPSPSTSRHILRRHLRRDLAAMITMVAALRGKDSGC